MNPFYQPTQFAKPKFVARPHRIESENGYGILNMARVGPLGFIDPFMWLNNVGLGNINGW